MYEALGLILGSFLQENTSPLSKKDKLLCHFVEMGYSTDEILVAIDKCGEYVTFVHYVNIIRLSTINIRFWWRIVMQMYFLPN